MSWCPGVPPTTVTLGTPRRRAGVGERDSSPYSPSSSSLSFHCAEDEEGKCGGRYSSNSAYCRHKGCAFREKGVAQDRGPRICAVLEYAAARKRHIFVAPLYSVPLPKYYDRELSIQGAALQKVGPRCAAPWLLHIPRLRIFQGHGPVPPLFP